MKFLPLIFLFCFLFFSQLFSEFYMEVYGGALFGKVHFYDINTQNTDGQKGLNGSFSYSTTNSIDPTFIGGLNLGGWFANQTSSSLTKYFGSSLDFNGASFSYDLSPPITLVTYSQVGSNTASTATATKFSSSGYAFTTSLLLTFRFGAFPTKNVCFGILQPFFAIGPSLAIIRQDFTFKMAPNIADGSNLGVFIFNDKKLSLPKKTFLAPALAADIGFRFMLTKKFFLSTIVKYYYTHPSFSYKKKIHFHPELHLIGYQLGLGYTF